MKRDIENRLSENDTEEYLSSRQSFRARQHHRLAQSFERTAEATERARTTPPKTKDRPHVLSLENITGHLDQLLNDVKSWPDGHINWSEKAKKYNVRTKGQDATPPNGGQMVKSFLERKGIDISHFDVAATQNKDDFQGKVKGILFKSIIISNAELQV